MAMQCSSYKQLSNRILLFYKHLQALSIDVVLGACINTSLIACYLRVSIDYVTLFALASATWIIYTADHLLDAQKLADKSLTFRYSFHHTHRKKLIWIVYILLLVNIICLYFLPFVILKNGIITALGVLAYFGLLKLAKGNPSFFKELTIGFIYVIAIFLAPLSLYESQWDTTIYILFVAYFLLAMINLLEFSYFDVDIDEKANHSSLVRKLGKDKVKYLIGFIVLLLFIIIIFCLSNSYIKENPFFIQIQFCIFLMDLVLSLFIIFPRFFRQNDYYRIFGDMVFLFPAALVMG